MNHGLRCSIPMLFENVTAVMPPSDAGVRLPWIGLQRVGLAHLEIANQSAQNRLRHIFYVEYCLQFASISPDIFVVIVRHDWRGELRHAEPYVEFSAGRGAGIERPVAVIVEIQKVWIVFLDQVLDSQHK